MLCTNIYFCRICPFRRFFGSQWMVDNFLKLGIEAHYEWKQPTFCGQIKMIKYDVWKLHYYFIKLILYIYFAIIWILWHYMYMFMCIKWMLTQKEKQNSCFLNHWIFNSLFHYLFYLFLLTLIIWIIKRVYIIHCPLLSPSPY